MAVFLVKKGGNVCGCRQTRETDSDRVHRQRDGSLFERITNPIFNRYYNNFLLEMQSKVNEMKN